MAPLKERDLQRSWRTRSITRQRDIPFVAHAERALGVARFGAGARTTDVRPDQAPLPIESTGARRSPPQLVGEVRRTGKSDQSTDQLTVKLSRASAAAQHVCSASRPAQHDEQAELRDDHGCKVQAARARAARGAGGGAPSRTPRSVTTTTGDPETRERRGHPQPDRTGRVPARGRHRRRGHRGRGRVRGGVQGADRGTRPDGDLQRPLAAGDPRELPRVRQSTGPPQPVVPFIFERSVRRESSASEMPSVPSGQVQIPRVSGRDRRPTCWPRMAPPRRPPRR